MATGGIWSNDLPRSFGQPPYAADAAQRMAPTVRRATTTHGFRKGAAPPARAGLSFLVLIALCIGVGAFALMQVAIPQREAKAATFPAPPVVATAAMTFEATPTPLPVVVTTPAADLRLAVATPAKDTRPRTAKKAKLTSGAPRVSLPSTPYGT